MLKAAFALLVLVGLSAIAMAAPMNGLNLANGLNPANGVDLGGLSLDGVILPETTE